MSHIQRGPTEAKMAYQYLSCVLADYAPHHEPAPNLLALCVQIDEAMADVRECRVRAERSLPIHTRAKVSAVAAAASLLVLLGCDVQ
jgi:hypothetical protein